jgi:hypothetical protein
MFLIALAALAAPLQSNPVSCPVMGGPIDPKGVTAEYRGVRYQFCCDGCDTQFAKSPEKYIADQAKKGLTTGVFLYDPVSRLRVEPERAIPGFSDYRGTRYNFLTAEDKALFDKDPKKYATTPSKEALFCPVTPEPIPSYGKASGYADYQGTRYYFCCAGCETPFGKDPAKYAPNSAKFVQKPSVLFPDRKPTDPNAVPATYLCTHCGWPITVKTKEELAKPCAICKCGKTNGGCRPGGN